VICPACYGRGQRQMVAYAQTSKREKTIKCPVCNGDGELSKDGLRRVEEKINGEACQCGCRSNFSWDFDAPWMPNMTLVMCGDCGKVVDTAPREGPRSCDDCDKEMGV